MICLHITAKKDDSGLLLEIDRLEREDASPEEARVIDLIHDMLRYSARFAENLRGIRG